MYKIIVKINLTLKILALICCSFFLFGCSGHHYFEKVKLMRSDDYHAMLLMEQMKKNGVVVTQNEKMINLHIPDRYLFYSESANLNYYAHPMLDNVVKLLGYYDSDLVEVSNSNYFDKTTANIKREQSVSQERARQVMKYLWSQGVNASFIYPEGKLIKRINKNDKLSEDYIDINFEKYYR